MKRLVMTTAQRHRWTIIAETAGVVVSASFALGMMIYVFIADWLA